MDADRLLGIKTRKERERDQVETKIDRCVKDLNYYSYPSDGIQSIDADAVLQAAGELKRLIDQWGDLNTRIAELGKEVGP